MARPRISWRLVACALLVGALATACDVPPEDSAVQDVRARLVGTWLRAYEDGGVKVRRVLVLEPDGHFREAVSVAGAASPEPGHQHGGEWLFDGTNLKRRYTSIDGKQPAAPVVPFATFELQFSSRNEFTGLDRVRGRKVQYLRVPDGTQP